MIKALLILILFLGFSACSKNNSIVKNPITGDKPTPGLFSKDSKKGILFQDLLQNRNDVGISANVNGYLWRASLNVLSIAPLISTDALGGTIITDWYINKNVKNQRIKITAFIETSELRSDGLTIKVHLQNLKNGIWSDIIANQNLANQIENQILNEARNLRINSLK